MDIKVGVKNKVSERVVYEKTAKAMGSGLQPVYATPCMVALMEKCCCESVIPYLEEGLATVGTAINIKHLSATPMEREVYVESVLKEVDRRRLVFEVTAYDEAGKIGEGEHERFIIDTEKFLKKAQEK